jgi:hypothetical protein
MNIDWLALLNVSLVTIIGAVAIVGLLCFANWLLTPAGEAESVPGFRRVAGYGLIGVMGLLVIAGIALLIPYFH